jgi:hypothetical protein
MNLPRVTLLAPRILMWFLDFWKMCAPFVDGHHLNLCHCKRYERVSKEPSNYESKVIEFRTREG